MLKLPPYVWSEWKLKLKFPGKTKQIKYHLLKFIFGILKVTGHKFDKVYYLTRG